MSITESMRSLRARASEMVRGRQIADELDEELLYHLELEIERNVSRGMSPEEARRAAMSAFGGVQRFREETRDARGFAALDSLSRDTRFALRRLRRAPVFAAGVIATLAIGLGAATGIGALVYGVMLRPLPYPDPDRLVQLSIATPGLGIVTAEHSSGTFVFFQERARSFAALGAYMENDGVTLTDGDTPERTTSAILTPNLFAILHTRPALGRLFRDEDALADTLAVLISHELWQRRYGGDSGIIGRRIEINRGRREVLGVLPRGFDFPSRAAAVYYPDRIETTRADLGSRYLTVVGRLRDNVTVEQAQAEVASLIPSFHARFPEMSAEAVRQSGLRATVRTLRGAIIEPVRRELTLLAIMVAVVLLIATTNVATLYLLRAERLRGEVAVSRALGAGRAALTQRFVVEGLVIALAGGIAAFPVTALAVSTRFGFTDGQVPRLYDVRLGAGVLVGLVALSAVIGMLLGVVAAARAGGGIAAATLRGDGRATASVGWRRVQQGLVTVQVALALALLLGAGLMARSLARLREVDIGFVPARGSTFKAYLPFSPYPRYQATAAFHFKVLEGLRSLPGVTATTVVMQFPLTPHLLMVHPRLEADRDQGEPLQAMVTANIVAPDFFKVMGVPITAGRTFQSGDLSASAPGVVISASLAHELFGGRDPIGRTVRVAKSRRYPPYRIVGVSGDVYGERVTDGVLRMLYFPLLADMAPADTAPIMFMPSGVNYVIRSDLPLEQLVPSFRRVVAAIDPRVAVWGARTLDNIVAESTARIRLTMLLLAMAAAATLLLGAIGLYSVIAYAVAGRTGEFAVRLALGATPSAIMGLVLREGAIIAVAGTVVGVGVSLASGQLLRGILYGVSATDPLTYVAGALLVLIATLGAMYIPARRAGDADPARVLRGT